MADQTNERAIRVLNRLRSASIIGFALAFAMLLIVTFTASFPNNPNSTRYLGITAVAMVAVMLLSVLMLIGSIIARDIIDRKRHRWRFSIRSFLILVTVLAMSLAMLMAALR